MAAQGDFDLAVDGKFVRKMNPESATTTSAMPMTEASDRCRPVARCLCLAR